MASIATRLTLYASTALTALISAPAFCQNSPSNNAPPVAIEDIVVTAQRRSENLQDVPVSVSAFDAATLQSRNATSTADLVRITPGLQFGSGNIQRNELTIRGIGSNRFDVGGESSSGVFIDDLYQPRFSNLLLDLLDVERVEVLKGPQGTLYGRNTIGGAIAVYTPTPDQNLHIRARVDAGTKGLIGGQASVSGPLSDTLAASISLGYRTRDGFFYDTVTKTDDGIESMAGRVKLVWQPIAPLKFTFTGGAFSTTQKAVLFNRLTNTAFLTRPGIDPGPDTDRYSGAYSYPTGAQTRSRMASARIDYEGSAVGITSITGYQFTRDHVVDDQDASILDAFGYDGTNRSRAFSQEFRITSQHNGGLSMDGRLKWVLGLYYFQEKADEAFTFKLGPDSLFVFLAQNAGVPVPGGSKFDTASKDITTRSYAVFGQASYALTNTLNLTLGGRYTRDEKSLISTGVTNVPGFPLIAANFRASASRRWSQFTPKVAVDFKVADRVMIYGSYAQGYKSGAPQSVSFNPLIATRLIDPETVSTIELGVKSEFLDRHVRLNVAAYRSKFKDLQVRLVADLGNGAPQPVLLNAANSTIQGIEVEASLVPLDGLRFDIGYNYLDAHYGVFVPQPGLDYSGNTLPRAPEHTLSVSAKYDVTLVNQGKLSFNAMTYFASKQYFQPSNSALVSEPNYSTSDLNVGYTFPDGRLAATAWVKNVFDKQYRTYVELNGPSGRETWADRRTAGLTISYRM